MMNTAITEQFFNRTFVPAMSESAAWREAARRIEENGLTHGICLVLLQMQDAGLISQALRFRMCDTRIDATHKEKQQTDAPSLYLFPEGEANERVLLCLFFALLAEDEGR